MEPENITVLQNLGIFYYNTGNYNQALTILERAVGFDATQDKSYYYIALSYFNLSDYENAIKYVDFAIEINPADYYYIFKSKILYNSGNIREAANIARSLLNQGFIIDSAYRNLLGI